MYPVRRAVQSCHLQTQDARLPSEWWGNRSGSMVPRRNGQHQGPVRDKSQQHNMSQTANLSGQYCGDYINGGQRIHLRQCEQCIQEISDNISYSSSVAC